MADKSYPLNNGIQIPALGLGTWQGPASSVRTAVSHALLNGYRLIDGAYCYANEEAVGQGIADALATGTIKREDIFVVTKIWATYNTRVELGLDKSLKALGLDYVDLLLVHWPLLMNPEGNDDRFPKLEDGRRDIIWGWDHVEVWKQMEGVLGKGKVRGIGVSNYSKRYLEQLLPHATVIPAVNQIENHPALPQQEIVDLCKEKGIHIMAYSPFGSTGVARGSTVLAKSVTPERIDANKKLIDLDTDDVKLLNDYSDALTKEGKLQRFVYPPFGVDFGFPDKS
ncbi:hypothetical protein OQA88_4515 [Cercophora sp. LCS_1]